MPDGPVSSFTGLARDSDVGTVMRYAIRVLGGAVTQETGHQCVQVALYSGARVNLTPQRPRRKPHRSQAGTLGLDG